MRALLVECVKTLAVGAVAVAAVSAVITGFAWVIVTFPHVALAVFMVATLMLAGLAVRELVE